MSDEASELSIHDAMAFGLSDTISKVVEALKKKVKCSLNAVGELLAESDLLDTFLELKQDVESLLQNDLKNCLQADGLLAKLKYAKLLNANDLYRFYLFISLNKVLI